MAATDTSLDDRRIEELITLIKDSFRVRPNHDPLYIDLANNLDRVAAPQHQVVFGRRGSGKSCLLVHFHRKIAIKKRILSLYIDSDEIKRLGYPDLLIRMLLTITEQLPAKHRRFKWLGKPTPVGAQVAELRGLLDMAESSEVTKDDRAKRESKADAQIGARGIKTQIGETTSQESAIVSKFKAEKLDTLERHLQDYKSVIKDALKKSDFDTGAVIVDDFYLFQRPQQPDIVDYLHRLLRGTDLYLKLGTVRHRTSLMRFEGQAIGVEIGQDVEEISLDRTFEDVDSTRDFLRDMLNSMCMKVGIEGGGATFISPDGLLQLTLASGGVPRDYLNTLVEAVPVARSLKQQRVTPRAIYRGAGRLSYRTKLKNLRDDVADDAGSIERVFSDIATFCLKEERKTGFLINQQEVTTHEAQHEVIQQLMDFKLIHVIEPDTSAASGRQGRFEAYTLDFALFMEPRLRGINHIEFWTTDEQRRRKGVREAPVYPLTRAADAMEHDTGTTSEDTLDGIEQDLGVDPVGGVT
ncbi:MAG: hypothetical protein LT070_07130 [Solirubrobacteraceae bacterium]|nr:hypothetical protein [Solirubrobacteraceae bacterium]